MTEQAPDAGGPDEEYTAPEKVVNVQDAPGRPEVFVEARQKDVGPDATLLRDSDAIDLYHQLGEYLRGEGYDV